MSSKSQQITIGLLVSILLLSLVIFRLNLFDKSEVTITLYKILVFVGIITFTHFLSKILRIKSIILLGLVVFVEIGISWYSTRVIENQDTNVYKLSLWREYFNQHRNLIQFDPEMAVKDPKLGYKLKAGTFRFTVSESSIIFKVNSFGLRDDEKSLQNPKIIALGDSQTMGWGVEQDQSFTQQLETKIGTSVLNTGISSYGTAREYLIFKQIQRDSCKVLVIQYSENDFFENVKFLDLKADSFEETEFDDYQSSVNLNKLYKSYYPFKNIIFLMRYGIQNFDLKAIFNNQSNTENYAVNDDYGANHAKNLFDVILKIQKIYDGSIIVLNMPSDPSDGRLSRAFEVEKNKRKLNKVFVIDTSHFLEQKDLYLIDGHLKVTGHQKIANTITEIIKKNQLL
jgi:hypothetical protein